MTPYIKDYKANHAPTKVEADLVRLEELRKFYPWLREHELEKVLGMSGRFDLIYGVLNDGNSSFPSSFEHRLEAWEEATGPG